MRVVGMPAHGRASRGSIAVEAHRGSLAVPGPSFGFPPKPNFKLQKPLRRQRPSTLEVLPPAHQEEEAWEDLSNLIDHVAAVASTPSSPVSDKAALSPSSEPNSPVLPQEAGEAFGVQRAPEVEEDIQPVVRNRRSRSTSPVPEAPEEEQEAQVSALLDEERPPPVLARFHSSSRPRLRKMMLPKQDLQAFKPPLRSLSLYEEVCLQRKILPKFLGKVKEAVNGDVFDLCSSGLGDEQLAALLEDEQLVPTSQIFRWRLRDVRLTHRGAELLANVWSRDVQAIDLACNEIGAAGVESISRVMSNNLLRNLRRLDVSRNGLGDSSSALLSAALTVCPKLLRVDLCGNNIQDVTGFGFFVAGHKCLTRISLARNRIPASGVAAIFEGALVNTRKGGQLADIDIAWNSCHQDAMVAAEAIKAVFQESASLYHCNLSYCGMDAKCCALIAEGLKDNHSLYGLHIVGNEATMDADGFLTAQDPAEISGMVQEVDPRSPSLCFGGVLPGPQQLIGSFEDHVATAADDDLGGRDAAEQKTACWACEGWQRIEIEWPYEGTAPKAVWAFTSLDGFKSALRLHHDEDFRRFVGARMVPPRYRLLVVFQVDSDIRKLPDAEIQALQEPAEVELRLCKELPSISPDPKKVLREAPHGKAVLRVTKACVIHGRTTCCQTPPSVLMAKTVWRGIVLDGPEGGASSVLMPRITETEFRGKAKFQRGPSFWSGFKREGQSLSRAALQIDWPRCRLPFIDDSEVEQVMQVLEPSYAKLMSLYRRYSAIDVSGESDFGVGSVQAAELMMGAGIVDGTVTKTADVDRFYIAAKVTPAELKKQLAVVNDKTIVRYEFLELLLRTCYQRFYQSGAAASMAEAVVMLCDALEAEGRKTQEETAAFFESLYSEVVDDVYKKHADALAAIYKLYSGSRTPPGKAKYMCLLEFQKLLEASDAYDSNFQPRLTAVAFRMGMQVQVDESGSSRFQEMNQLEFLHAIGAPAFLSLQAASSPITSEALAAKLDEQFTEGLPKAALAFKEAKGKAKRR